MAKKMSAKKRTEIVQNKCNYYRCKKIATGSISCDIDVASLYFCKEHKSDIKSALLWTILGVEELAQHSMGLNKKLVRKPLGEAVPLKAQSKNAHKGKRG